MRKALLAATVAIATMTSAVTVSAADFGLDIKGGLNIANMRGKSVDNNTEGGEQSPRLGMIAGIGAQIGLAEKFAIQPEVLFAMKGYKAEWTGEGWEETETNKATYLSVPVLFKVKFPTEKLVPNFYAGPEVSFLLAAEEEWEEKVDGEEESGTEDVKKYGNTVDFGLAFGGGVDFKVGEKGRVILDLRYTLGLTGTADYDEITKDWGETKPAEEEFEAKNGAFSIMLGYGIDF